MSFAISTDRLTRRFRGQHGVDGIDLRVPEACIVGFLGPNGAGKTTTIRLLMNLLKPDSGSIRLFDQPLNQKTLAMVGALVESPSLYPHLTGHENLEVTQRLLGLPKARIAEVLARVDLLSASKRRVREYSLGMRQRLGLALALLNRPRLIILDEPSNGLDPAGISELRTSLQVLARNDGVTVFLSSHLLSEVEILASHVAVINAGRLRFQGTIGALKGLTQSKLHLACNPRPEALTVLARHGVQAIADGAQIQVTVAPERDAEVNRLLVQAGIDVSQCWRPEQRLEQLFFELTSATHDQPSQRATPTESLHMENY